MSNCMPWTVPLRESSDASVATMPEPSYLDGSPRLPALLQLPSPESITPPTPTTSPSYSPDRLKMRTRVAVRDKTPHRFQVVPLRDARSHINYLPTQDHLPPVKSCKRPPAATGATFPPGRLKSRAAQNFSARTFKPTIQENPRNKTHERKPLVELDKNILEVAPALSTIDQPNIETTPISRSPLLSGYTSSVSEYSQAIDESCPDLCRLRSSLQSNSKESHKHRFTRHFKSPSLGNPLIETTPTSTIEGPSRTGSWNRTNMFSIDNYSDRPGHPPSSIPDYQKTVERDLLKRHAIYSRPYLPAETKRSVSPSSICSIHLHRGSVDNAEASLCGDSAMYINHLEGQNLGEFNSQRADNMTGILRSRLDPPFVLSQWTSFESQSSMSSVYSQDALSLYSQAALIQTRPLTYYGHCPQTNKPNFLKADEDTITHHPIIATLLEDVQDVMLEWSCID